MLREINKQEVEEIKAIVQVATLYGKAVYSTVEDNDLAIIEFEDDMMVCYTVGELLNKLKWDIATKLGGSKEDYMDRFHIYKGATKLVIDDVERDYVIKIPLEGEASTDDDGIYYQSFNYEYDYCDIEKNIYEDLPYCVKPLFAETQFLCTLDNSISIYIQEKVTESFYDSEQGNREFIYGDLPENEKATMRSFNEKRYTWTLEPQFIYDILLRYGEMTVEELMYVIDYFSITDLHSRNYGYQKDGKPKIYDYSGYEF
jgi:hypothetical protein